MSCQSALIKRTLMSKISFDHEGFCGSKIDYDALTDS